MKSLEDLKKIRDEMRKNIALREKDPDGIRILVGMATCGISAGARQVLQEFINQVDKKNIRNVIITQTGCMGLCKYEPIVEVIFSENNKATYINVTPEKVAQIVDSHIVSGNVVKEYAIDWNN